jgi:hypothetical protein
LLVGQCGHFFPRPVARRDPFLFQRDRNEAP